MDLSMICLFITFLEAIMLALRKIASVVLLLVFLFSNNGITVYKNTCPMSGKVTCQYFLNSCCCSGEKGSGCCETTVNHFKFAPDGYSNSDHFQAEAPIILDFTPFDEGLLHFSASIHRIPLKEQVDYPPPNPLSGKDLLIKYETFLI